MRRPTLPRCLLVVLAVATVPAWARDLPNLDVTARPRATRPGATALSAATTLPGVVSQRDDVRGVPTIVWAEPGRKMSSATALTLDARQPADVAARAHLAEYAGHWGLTAQDVADLEVRHVHDTGLGAIVVQFQHRVGSLLVWRETLSVVLDQHRAPVSFNGWVKSAPGAEALAASSAFRLDHRAAVASAYRDLTGAAGPALVPTGRVRGEYVYFQHTSGGAPELLITPARARQILFRGTKGLEPAYYLELETREQSSGRSYHYAYVVSARDGSLLVRTNLTQSDAYSYRVWADGSGQFRPYDSPFGTAATPNVGSVPEASCVPALPAVVAPDLVTLSSGPISTNDPWLPAGAIETRGNNADAYADLIPDDGFTAVNPGGGMPDVRADVTSPGTFDRTYDVGLSAEANATQIKAAVTQLFFNVNWLHDWYYDVGFDEAAGNAQASNLGRTSADLEEDVLLAEADDFSGLNNANMTTPADGASPRMQMYVFSPVTGTTLTVVAPAAIAGCAPVGPAQFGPQSFTLTGDVAQVDDGTGTTSDGCEGGYGGVAGKIALIDRGTCTFVQKVLNAQAAGATGVVIVNNVPGTILMAGDDATITIPAVSVTPELGAAIRGQLGAGVTVTLSTPQASALAFLDGALDNTIVAHEWGHYIAHRLVGGGDGFNAQVTNGMGEGWSDFHALLMIVRPEDAAVSAAAGFSGMYPVAQYAWSDRYFGIRRYPYSTDMTKDPLTFKHITDGVPLPPGVPNASFGGDNSEVHNTGEVWASMLWECYAALLNDSRRSFQEAQDQMRRYLVAAYKATPANTTFTEARDALLSVALANDQTDYQAFGRAFAKRGLGSTAVSPSRTDVTNGTASPLSESFIFGKSLILKGMAVQETQGCDQDGVLDQQETGKLVVTLQNLGADAVSNIAVAVTTPTVGVTVGNGGTATLASLAGAQTAQVEVPITLGAITGIQTLYLNVTVTSSDLAVARITSTLIVRINADELDASSATDSVEATGTVWTTTSAPHLNASGQAKWARSQVLADAKSHEWLGPDADSTADESLVSPPLAIPGGASFSVTFKARWDEETDDQGNHYDGVVVEISDDNGASWKDVTTAGGTLSPAYNSTLFTDPTEPLSLANPLQGRPAYAGNNPSYPASDTVTLSFGTTYAGKTVLLRFRAGSDGAVSADGFELDDISFAGITGTPFGTIVPDRHICVAAPAASGSGGCSATGRGQGGMLTLSALLLFVILSRRSRRHRGRA